MAAFDPNEEEKKKKSTLEKLKEGRKKQEKLDLGSIGEKVLDVFSLKDKAEDLKVESAVQGSKSEFKKQVESQKGKLADATQLKSGQLVDSKIRKPKEDAKVEKAIKSANKEVSQAKKIEKVEEEVLKSASDEELLKPQEDMNTKNKPNTSSQFEEAMAFFSPAIIGGIIGAAFEGGAGAMAGIQQGQSLGQAFRDHQMKVAASKSKGGLTPYQVEQLKRRDEKMELDKMDALRRQKQYLINKEKHLIDKEKASQLTDGQVKAISSMDAVEASIDSMEKLIKDVSIGPAASRLQSMGEVAGLAPDKFTELKTISGEALASYLHTMSGTAVNAEEVRRIQQIVPNINDNKEVFMAKSKALRSIMKRNKKAFEEAIRTGQPLRAASIEGLAEAERQFSSRGTGLQQAALEEAKRRGLVK